MSSKRKEVYWSVDSSPDANLGALTNGKWYVLNKALQDVLYQINLHQLAPTHSHHHV